MRRFPNWKNCEAANAETFAASQDDRVYASGVVSSVAAFRVSA
jgi:hypothetical protein